jgi:hypothetical protein
MMVIVSEIKIWGANFEMGLKLFLALIDDIVFLLPPCWRGVSLQSQR